MVQNATTHAYAAFKDELKETDDAFLHYVKNQMLRDRDDERMIFNLGSPEEEVYVPTPP